MANITRVKPGGWANKEVYTSAQKNLTDERWLRCAVNDGQTDLQANSSFSGGGTRSFGFVALTSFGVTSTGAQSFSAGSFSFSTSGDVVQTCNDFLLDASGDVTLDAAGDLDLVSAQDITFNPVGTFGGVASKALFSGTGWPALGSRNLDDVQIGSTPIRGTQWVLNADGQAFQSTADVSDYTLFWPFRLPPGVSIRSAKILLSGGPGGTPSVPAQFRLYRQDMLNNGLATAITPAVTDAGGGGFRTVTLTPPSPYAAQATDRLVVYCRGFGGTSFGNSLVVYEPRVDLTVASLRLY